LYKACEANKRPAGMSIRQFLALGDQFSQSLTVHHSIEERYIFPVLAERMPNFKDQEHLKKQHEGIHAGLDVFEQYIKDCRSGEKELRLEEMKRIMDTFGEVLWKHLDDEVEELKADNMRKFWTAKELQSIPF
jgi:hemerythrin-like domain-containing protein